MTGSGSPKDDVDGRRARLRQRLREIAPSATHEYLSVAAQAHPVDRATVSAAPLAAPPPPGSTGWTPLSPGEPWGAESELLTWGYPADGGSVTWLRAHLDVPAEWADDDVLLGLDDPRLGTDRAAVHGIGFEALVHLDGVVLAGMDDPHRAVLLPADRAGRGAEILLRATTAARRPFAGLRLLRRHRDTWQLGVLAHTLLGVADALPDGDVTATALYSALDDAYRTLDLRAGWNSDPLRRSASRALPTLRAAVPTAPPGHRPSVVASGHAHLDVAWLWPVWRTRQKVAHTVATALNLMDHYPDYHFSLSAPQTWLFLEQDVPELYARARARAAQGRLEPVGVFWLESDGNLPSGESFVRQIRHGIRFYADRLGVVPNAAWLPDSFGFTAALPAILNGFGVKTLLTTKLSWNRVNRMPADTFRWRAPDGSEVLAHFVTTSAHPVGHPTDPAAHTYAGDMSPAEVAGLWAHYRGKQVSSEVLYLYGHGDGGGGPTEEMVAAAAAMADLPGFPQVRLGRAAEFFDRLQLAAWDHPRLPTWSGDLYFEMHRGTLTGQQRTKRANRDGELAMRAAEWVNAWAVLHRGTNHQPELDGAWETLLRNQFHDILPGSSIPVVYVDAAAEHEQVRLTAGQVSDQAFGVVLPDPNGEVVVNGLPWPRTELVAGPGGSLRRVRAPSYGWSSGDHQRPTDALPGTVFARASEGGWVLENGLLRAVLDDRGELVSLVELASGFEAIAAADAANRLVMYEDRPLHWDAWDVDAFYPDKATPLDDVRSIQGSVDPAQLRGQVRIVRRSGATTVIQTIGLDAGSPRLDLHAEVDWQERQVLLRALFPFSPNASHATLGRQFGRVEVPVHRNTSWEQARFEVAAHGWLDVADGGGGVALLTDALYGHSAVQRAGGVGVDVGVSLLKSGAWPDPRADAGRHLLRYALLPHSGSWQQAGIPRRALELAVPLQVRLGPDGGSGSLLTVESDQVIAETVKAAWDGDGLVVRCYEAHNRSGRSDTVTLRLDPLRPLRSAALATLDEVDLEPLEVRGNEVTFPVRPHQLVTVRLRW